MCGISGVFSDREDWHKIIAQSYKSLAHRGPDYESCLRVNKDLSLAHNRLAIVDLHARSNQPFKDELTGNYLIFNGEIFNFKELKKELPNRTFITDSDTEVLLYLISDLGINKALSKCNGMFAFAFWESSREKLYLGRDRFGQKPLFYYYKDNDLVFGSEAKGIIPFVPELKVNHDSVVNYLFEITIGKNDHSFFNDINQVKNGYVYEFSKDGKQKIQLDSKSRYWDYPKKTIKISYEEATNRLNELLQDAIKIRLSEEVEFAVMLSGGLDSSAISSYAAYFNPDKKITSISAVYPGDPKDESDYARLVTDKYQNLKALWIDDIDYKLAFDKISDVIYHLECPLADGSLIAQHILMNKIGEKGIRVILSGNGGDEVLAGYPKIFFPAKDAEMLSRGKLSHFSFRAFYHLLPNRLKNYIYKLKHKQLGILKDTSVLNGLWSRFKTYGTNDILNNYLINGIEHWSLPNLMWYEDRNSMSASIESRCPLLDYRIVEFLMTLPAEYKIDNKFTKKILRDSTRGIVPEPILERTDKQGFHAPNDVWVNYIDSDFLDNKKFREEFYYLDFEKIRNSPFRTYWRTYTLYLWYMTFFASGNSGLKD